MLLSMEGYNLDLFPGIPGEWGVQSQSQPTGGQGHTSGAQAFSSELQPSDTPASPEILSRSTSRLQGNCELRPAWVSGALPTWSYHLVPACSRVPITAVQV